MGDIHQIRSQMAATVIAIKPEIGDEVVDSSVIVYLESMKMEVPIYSSVKGVVRELHVSVGDPVESGDLIATITLEHT